MNTSLAEHFYITINRDLSIAYVRNYKAGSTTIIHLLNAMGATEEIVLHISQARAWREANRDLFVFSFVRNPYDRLVSGYYDKLNRYVKKFERKVYLYAKLRQLLSGPAAWKSHRFGIKYAKEKISFEDLITGLQKNGIAFDYHFDLQSRCIGLELFDFDEVYKLEEYEESMIKLLGRCGEVGEIQIKKINETRKNTTTKSRDHQVLPQNQRDAVYALYESDFVEFSYPHDQA